MSVENAWANKTGSDNGNEILECEENGFDSIQPALKKPTITINNFDDEPNEKVEESLSPLASKTQKWNNNFQENLFEELDEEKAGQQNKDTSEYLFNYDL